VIRTQLLEMALQGGEEALELRHLREELVHGGSASRWR